jgi:hypothetical protein
MIETDEDRALFFDPAVFGETAIVTIGDADPFTVAVIFDTRPPFTATNFKGFSGTDDMGRGFGEVAGASPRIMGATSALAAIKAGRATIVVAGQTYTAYRNTPDGTGMSIVELKEAD